MVTQTVEAATDALQTGLKRVAAEGSDVDKLTAAMGKEITELKKRKLVAQQKLSAFTVTKGPKFSMDLKKAAAELTAEMIQSGSWKTTEFKTYNLATAQGVDIGA